MTLRIDNPIPQEEFLYLVKSKDKNPNGNELLEIAQYRKGKFWFFGWEMPEPLEKFDSWKELVVAIKDT
jgi:hypothetical protein